MIKLAVCVAVIYAISLVGLMMWLALESKKLKQRQEELKAEIERKASLTNHRIEL